MELNIKYIKYYSGCTQHTRRNAKLLCFTNFCNALPVRCRVGKA